MGVTDAGRVAARGGSVMIASGSDANVAARRDAKRTRSPYFRCGSSTRAGAPPPTLGAFADVLARRGSLSLTHLSLRSERAA